MTDVKKRKGLALEILGLLAVTLVISLAVMLFLSLCGSAVVERVLYVRDIVLTDSQLLELNDRVFQLSLLISVAFFIFLFLFLLGERLSYIKEIVKGITALQKGQQDYTVPLEGSNELTALAEAVVSVRS